MKNVVKYFAALGLLALAATLIPATVLSQGPYPDVSGDHLNKDAIEYLTEQGVIEGYPDGTYKPTQTINRAEFTKILMEAKKDVSEMTDRNCFPDVNNEWFAPYVCEAKAEGLIEGYPDGTFKPGDDIDFTEAAKIIALSYQIDGQNDAQVWYKAPVTAMESEKAVPLSVEKFDENITRDEMAEMIWRLEADVESKVSRTYDEIAGDGVVTVNSCAELEERAASFAQPRYDYYEEDGAQPFILDSDTPNRMMETTSSGSMMKMSDEVESAPAEEYSSTNVQEAGVDEADVIKNDGKYIYLIKGNTIRIIDAYPADQMEELISFELGDATSSFYPSEMYVDDDTLTVIGTSYPGTIAYIVDITDREKPKVKRSVEFDGYYTTSRKIDDTLYLVMNKSSYIYDDVIIQETLPRITDSSAGTEEKMIDCADVRIMPKPSNFNYLITAAIPLEDEDAKIGRSVIVGSSGNVYASKENLYVAQSDYNWGFYSSSDKTKIYRFALSPDNIEYEAEGTVDGTVLNQFSMDEHAGHFRIATTEHDYDGDCERSCFSNHVTILDQNLEIKGSLKDLAPGEKIYSARFMGDRGYLVTFKKVDPLFVFDLSDPSNPEVLGELKIPGYSDYLHPYDENHLIGFGKDAEDVEGEDWGLYQGFKMALFDVTDPNNPKQIDDVIIGTRGTHSELLYNHKALLFDKAKNLIAFPISVYESPEAQNCRDYTYSSCPDGCQKMCAPSVCTYEDGVKICTTDCDGPDSCVDPASERAEMTFVGAYVYGVDLDKGFNFKGAITHLSEEQQDQLTKQGYNPDYEKTIQRIIYVGENLYTVSQAIVKANDLKTLEDKNEIELMENQYNLWYGEPEPIPLLR